MTASAAVAAREPLADRVATRGLPWRSRRVPLLLALWGVVLAIAGGAFLWVAVGDDWPLMPSRATELDAAFRAAEAGEPPLVGLRDDGERYAVGVSDDQGLFVYAPAVSRALGFDDPRDGLKALWIFCSMLAVAIAPLLYATLMGRLAAGVVAPVVLLVGVGSLRLEDIYWVAAWSMFGLLPAVLWLAVRRPRWWLAGLTGVMLLASFASSIRSHAGLAVLLAGVMVVIAQRATVGRRVLGVALLVAAYVAITPVGLALVQDARDNAVGRDLAAGAPRAHPVWHSAYIGLGYLPNDARIGYRDDIAWAHARREVPDVQYLSPEYERTLRRLTFDFVGDHPGFFVAQLAEKLVVMLRHAWPYLLMVALLVPWALSLGGHRRDKRAVLLLLAPALVLTSLPPLMTVPRRTYELGFFGLCVLACVLASAWLAAVAEDGGRAAARRSVRALVAAAGSAVRPPRAAWGGAAAIVCVAALAVAAGSSIEVRADRWAASLPPPNAAELRLLRD
jgi:hypothetical protein